MDPRLAYTRFFFSILPVVGIASESESYHIKLTLSNEFPQVNLKLGKANNASET